MIEKKFRMRYYKDLESNIFMRSTMSIGESITDKAIKNKNFFAVQSQERSAAWSDSARGRSYHYFYIS